MNLSQQERAKVDKAIKDFRPIGGINAIATESLISVPAIYCAKRGDNLRPMTRQALLKAIDKLYNRLAKAQKKDINQLEIA